MEHRYTNEQKLLIALRECDRLAYEYIYKKYYNELFLFARSYMLSHDEAHDTIHDTFASMLENASKINPNTDVKGFLYLSVKNNCINKLRHYNVEVRNRETVIEEMRFKQQNSNFEKERMEHKIKILIRQLSPQQQNVIKLKHLGKSYEEIAEELNISKLTVSVHVKRAYKFFRENILLFFTYLCTSFFIIVVVFIK